MEIGIRIDKIVREKRRAIVRSLDFIFCQPDRANAFLAFGYGLNDFS